MRTRLALVETVVAVTSMALTATASAAPANIPRVPVTVMTRNMDLGSDYAPALVATNAASFAHIGLMVAIIAAPVGGLAGPVAVESESVRTVDVPAAGISIGVPKTWPVVDFPSASAIRGTRAYVKDNPELARLMGLDANSSTKHIKRLIAKFGAKSKLVAVDPGNGDNVTVGIEHGPWWNNLYDWTSTAGIAARATHATVLDDEETRIGGRQAFMHLEQDPPQNGSTVYGYMEIEAGNNRSVSISINVDGSDRAFAESILRSVTTT